MIDKPQIEFSYRQVDGNPPENIIWQRLEHDLWRKFSAEMKTNKPYAIRLERAVYPSYDYNVFNKHSLEYNLRLYVEEAQTMRIMTVADMDNTRLFRSALQEVRSRLRVWAPRLRKHLAKEFAPFMVD